MYTYVRSLAAGTTGEPSLKAFLDRLSALGHFPTHYDTGHELLLHFSMQLDRLYGSYGAAQLPAAPSTFKSRDELMELVSQQDYFSVLDELNKFFKGGDDKLNSLIFEFTAPPGNFNPVMFAGRIRMFISAYYKP